MSRYDPDRHHRHSIRLRSQDYSEDGAYFITICTQERQLFFEDSRLTAIILEAWDNLPATFPTIVLDVFVVMPNHIHGLVWLHPRPNASLTSKPTTTDTLLKRPRWDRLTPALGEIVRSFKARSTQHIRRQFPHTGFAWQRNYYEHVIRAEETLHAIRQYIVDNPKQWELDRYNPQQTGVDPQSQTIVKLLEAERQGHSPA